MYSDGVDSCVEKLNVQSCMSFAHFHVSCNHLITTVAVLCITFCDNCFDTIDRFFHSAGWKVNIPVGQSQCFYLGI